VSRRPVVAISAGDPSGIGPEVLARALRLSAVRRTLTPVVFGDASLARALPGFACVGAPAQGPFARPTLVQVTHLPATARQPGKPTRAGGRAQWAYLQQAS